MLPHYLTKALVSRTRLDTLVIVEIEESGEPLTSWLTHLDLSLKEKEHYNRIKKFQI